MRSDALSPARLLQVLKLFGPQARRVYAWRQRLLGQRRRAVPVPAGCRCAAPAAALRLGHSYYWYVTHTNAGGHDAFAPAEGVFSVSERR